MSIKETKSTDITENPAKVKSNFDQITSTDRMRCVYESYGGTAQE